MRRREFLAGIGSVAMWPLLGRAQPSLPMVGFLSDQSPDFFADGMRGFHQGLKDTGYVTARVFTHSVLGPDHCGAGGCTKGAAAAE